MVFPADVDAAFGELRAQVDALDVQRYGPAIALVAMAPVDDDPAKWSCQIGYAVTGLGRATPPLLIEDYQGLQAVTLPHHGSVRQIVDTWRRLDDHARSVGWLPRPYWRIAMHRERTGDGTIFPDTRVSIFIDR